MTPTELYLTLFADTVSLGNMPVHERIDAWENGKIRARSDVARAVLSRIPGVGDATCWVVCARLYTAMSEFMTEQDIPRIQEMDFIFTMLGQAAEIAAVENSECSMEELDELSYKIEIDRYANAVLDILDEWKDAMKNLN